jgi:glycosyltransferase involved in cell wall biosynthesis
MSVENPKYVVISPVRDEEAYLRFTAECMVAQTIRPVEWIIVNDGSTDRTAEIIDEYAARYPWIRAVHRVNRGFRKAGGGVVEAFNDGYRRIVEDCDYIVKLDGDLSFDSDYFEKCFAIFRREPRLGIGGGAVCHVENGTKQIEHNPVFHVRGATKIYRKACWEVIGGFLPSAGWDTLDEVKANMLGWSTRTFVDLHLIHHRYTGSAEGLWKGWVKNGRANYICGYHPLFMAVKCISRLRERPFVVGSLALFYGYLSAYVRSVPQIDDRGTIEFLRQQQLGRLWGRETIWR